MSGPGGRPSTPLSRARAAALAFSIVATGSALLQLDHRLAAPRLTLAYLALSTLLLESVLTHWLGRTTWPDSVAGGLLVTAAAQGLAVPAATIAIALGAIAGQLLFATRWQAFARVTGVLMVIPTLTLLSPLLHSAGQTLDPRLGIVTAPIPIMFSALLRAFYNAIRRQQEASDRETLLARTSRELLGVTDVDQAQRLARRAIAELCDLTPGLTALVLRRRPASDGDPAADVEQSTGPSALPAGTRIDPTAGVWNRLGGHLLTPLDGDGPAVLTAAFHRQQLLGTQLGIDPDLAVLVGSRRKVPEEARAVLQTLAAQLALVETNCRSHAELITMAHHDALTSIVNRGTFFTRLTQVVDDAPAGAEDRVGLLLIDLDDFKIVNDTLGHAAGDQVLIEVADRMTRIAGENGVAARFGGDEFALLLPDVDSSAAADRIAERLRDSLIAPIRWQGGPVRVGASIGVINGAVGATAGDLMRCADIAMYSAKALGKNRVVRFSDSQHGSIAHLRVLEDHLPQAIDRGEIVLHYQPVVELGTGHCIGVEALARWEHPTMGRLEPSAFIPLAERSGQMPDLGQHVLTMACRQAMEISQQSGHAGLRLAVNISPRQLTDGDFEHVVRQALQSSGLPANRLTLELTETDLLDDRAVLAPFSRLRELGVQLALDDFGAGFASLATVRGLAIRQLKIDRQMLVGEDEATQADLVAMIMAVSQLLDLETVAEAIETAEHADWARRCGMTLGQGRLFCPPLPADQLPAWLAAAGRRPTSDREPTSTPA